MGGSIILLWAIGVGSVIGGDFFGWSYLLSSGIGSSTISLVINMAMYYYLAQGVSSLTTLIKMPGGADVYVSEGMGAFFGRITASLETAKIILTTCAIANGTVSYFKVLVGFDSAAGVFLSYFGLFLIFSFMNMLGTSFSGTFQIVVTCFSLVVLLFYWISVCTTIDFSNYALGDGGWFVDGASGFALAQPFAAWLFFGFEELPLVQTSIKDDEPSESPGKNYSLHDSEISFVTVSSPAVGSFNTFHNNAAHDDLTNKPSDNVVGGKRAKNNGDTAMLLSYLTVAAAGILTVFLGASSNPGAYALSSDNSPLIAGMKGVYGNGSWEVLLVNILVIIALVTPFNAFILYAAHHLCHQAHSGQLPSWFQKTKPWPFRAGQESEVEVQEQTTTMKQDDSSTPTNAVLAVGVCGLIVVVVMTAAVGVGAY